MHLDQALAGRRPACRDATDAGAGRLAPRPVTYDGSRVAAGVKVFIDGKPEKTKVLLDELNQTFNTKEPLRIGGGGGPDESLPRHIADVRHLRRMPDGRRGRGAARRVGQRRPILPRCRRQANARPRRRSCERASSTDTRARDDSDEPTGSSWSCAGSMQRWSRASRRRWSWRRCRRRATRTS